MTASVHLEPYLSQMVGESHQRLAADLLDWSLRICSCHRGIAWHARLAFCAATFQIHCAPADARPWENLLCGKFCALFMSIDDGPPGEVAALADGARQAGELGALHRALMTDMRSRGIRTDRLNAEIVALCSAVRDEVLPDAATTTWDQFHTARRLTAAADPYLTCWRGVRGLPEPPGRLWDIANEALCLANDAASAHKEMNDGHPTSNWVLLYAARSSVDVETAIDSAVSRYNEIAGLLGSADDSPIGALICDIVDGNTRALGTLAVARYPGSVDILNRLHRIRTVP